MARESANQPFVGQEDVLLTIPKNNVTETRVQFKSTATRASGQVQQFIDIREWWYKDGPTNEPIATRKGAMIHRHQVPKLILAMLQHMQPGELGDYGDKIAMEVAALNDKGVKQ